MGSRGMLRASTDTQHVCDLAVLHRVCLRVRVSIMRKRERREKSSFLNGFLNSERRAGGRAKDRNTGARPVSVDYAARSGET